MTDSWDEINESVGPYHVNLRRVDSVHPIDLYRGKDHVGNYLFCFHGSVSDPGTLELPNLGTIELGVRRLEEEGLDRWELSLKLLDPEQKDIFRALCADLLTSTEDLSSQEQQIALHVIVRRLQRWQEMLKARTNRALSYQARLGLFGELLFLWNIVLPRLSAATAVQAWRGAEGDEQDFLLPAGVVEVKTQLATADRIIRIASEYQLHSSSSPVWLCHQTISVGSSTVDSAMSLGALIDTIRTSINQKQAVSSDLFEARLIQYGYKAGTNESQEVWSLCERSWYRVEGEFPRITPDDIRGGVERVRYGVRLNECESCEVREQEALEEIFDRHE